MEIGRPKKTIDILPEKWYISILDLYKEGASDVEVKALIYSWLGSFSNDLWDRWIEEEEQFSETIKVGRVLSEAWWHYNGRTNLMTKDFSYTGWYMQMKNRFGWADNTKNDHTSKGEQINVSPITWIDGSQDK